MSVDVGSTAPDFTLMNQDRQPVTLSAQRGHPVVLAFFPGGVQLRLPEGAVHVPRSAGALEPCAAPRYTASVSIRSSP